MILVYLAGIMTMGIWVSRRVKNISDFLMPRRFGKFMMAMHAFGTGTASDQAVLVAAATFRSGLSGIWYQWLWLFSTPFYWLIAPIMRRFRAVTTADVLTLRFNHSVAVLFSIVGIIGTSVKIGLLLKGSGALIDSGTGGFVDANLAIIVMTVLFVLYGAAGGLGAAILTDFIQGLLTILFSIMLLPFILSAVGGMEGIRTTINDPAMLSLVAPGQIGVFFIVMISLQTLVGIIAQPHIMGVCGAGRTEMDVRFGKMAGNLIKRFCTVAWCLTGIAAVAWYMNQGVDIASIHPDNVYGNIAREFLPRISPGLLGIFMSALLAGVMSSCDSFMIAAAGLFTENIYRPYYPDRSTKHYLWIARIAGVVIVVGGVVFAFWISSVVEGLTIWLRIAPMMGISIWIALFWRRITVAGAWAATFTGFGVWFITNQTIFISALGSLPGAEALNFVVRQGSSPAQVYEPWKILFYTLAAVLAAVVVSLATKPVNRNNLDRFHDLMRTPVGPNEKITEPCRLPPGVEPAQRSYLVRRFGFEIIRPSATSVIGFLVGWVAVGFLVGGFFWFVKG